MGEELVGIEQAEPSTVEARKTLAALLDLKDRAEAATAAAEEANRKANSESGFAYNAKQNAEDHAKAIAQIRGTVDADSNWLTTTKKNADEAAAATVVARSAAEADAKVVSQARHSLETLNGSAESALSAIETAREDVGNLTKRVGEDAAAVTQNRTSADASHAAIAAFQQQISDAAGKVQTDANSVTTRAGESQSLLTSMMQVTETATQSHDRVIEYERRLAALADQIGQLHSKIEGLLPGATSAGLASAFRDQKARFARPQVIWGVTFVAAILVLLVLGAVGSPAFSKEMVTWDTTLRHIVSRLPVAVPLVWLALYAGRNYMLALRLQEDYAYKEAISTAFEGYRREMSGILVTDDRVLPVLTLSDNVLRTLAQRPGRLYDGEHEDVTPLTPVTRLIRDTKLLNVFGEVKGDTVSNES